MRVSLIIKFKEHGRVLHPPVNAHCHFLHALLWASSLQ